MRRFHADATRAGYRSDGEPGERPRYHAGYYAAFVLDPDGNNIEVVNHHHQRSHRLSGSRAPEMTASDNLRGAKPRATHHTASSTKSLRIL